MAHGKDSEKKLDELINIFEERYGINITVKKFKSTQDAYNAVVNEIELGKR